MDEKEYIKKKMALQEERSKYLLAINEKETQINLDSRRLIEIDWELTKLHELYRSCKQ